jgi:hypothetical protein
MKRVYGVLLLSLVIVFSTSQARAAKYDFFGGFIPEGTPVIDGVIQSGEWNEMGHITLYKFFGEDAKVEIYVMWDSTYLYLGADIEDYELWVDSYNPSSPWFSTWDDDALKWEIDPNYSRDEFLQSDDRVFAINANGTARRFDKGDGAGNPVGIWIDPNGSAVRTAAKIVGTLNDYTFEEITSENQKDGGFVLEIGIKWSEILGSQTTLSDGRSLGMNITNIEDDTGGTLDPEYYEGWKRVMDELTRFMGEEDHPENWAEFVLSAKSDRTPPAAVSNVKIARITPFSATLSFTAPGDNGSAGYARGYDIRYSASPITQENWASATVYPNSFRPQKAGKSETFKLIGFSPQTTYHIGIQAVDERGSVSAITAASFTTSAASAGDKGFLAVDPGGRYLAWENGTPFIVIGDNQGMSWPHIRTFYDGMMWSDDLGRYVNFQDYDTGGIENGRAYLKYLSDHGVNTVRLIAEDLQPTHPVYLFKDMSKGSNNVTFNQDTLNFLKTFLDECQAVGISVIIVPFDTFYYSAKFNGWAKSPFSTAMGGPMVTGEEFFNPAHREYIKAVLKKLVDTIGNRKNLLAWDIVNEFDSDEPGIGWNRAAFDKREETMNALADYMKSIDPNHMIYISSVRWDPKFTGNIPTTPDSPVTGSDAALILNNRRLDFNSTHMYYHDIRDPNYNSKTNPASIYRSEVCDLDNTVAPAARVKQGLQFYHAYALTPKPYMCTETGPIEFYMMNFGPYFTEEDDNQLFHNMIWSFLASGEVGSGLRWPGEALEDHKLTDSMRGYQRAMRNFLNAGKIDFRGFHPVQIGQYLKIESGSKPVVKTGITDGKKGIIFLVNDERKQYNGMISGARMTVPKLSPQGKLNFEIWDSYNSSRTTPVQTIAAAADASGKAVINLPSFDKTLVIKFYCTDCPEPDVSPPNGYLVTDDLWIRAVIQAEGKGPIEAVWSKGGQDVTARGDTVIWGYFYASPSDVSWGSPNNPDLFVKIWLDVNGPVYVDYFHVSVPDIEVYTDLPYDGTPDEHSTATLSNRFVEHYYINGVSSSKIQVEDGKPPAGYSPAGNPAGTTLIKNLRVGAMINTTDKGSIEGVWRLGGQDKTARGDEVVWGYFYADPKIVSWGSANNPDLYMKIWFDVSGAVFVDYFHVSVPDIEVYSDMPKNGTYENKGTTILSNRYIEFRY